MPGREGRLIGESIANARWGFASSLATCLLRFLTVRFAGFSPFLLALFPDLELGLMRVRSTAGVN